MPNLMLLILGLLLIMSLATYVIPAGEFATDPETGKLIGDQFNYLGYQTPVNPWAALNLIYNGIVNSGAVIATLLAMGGATQIILETKAIDKMMDYAIYKLKDKGFSVLMISVCVLFLIYGTFSGGDFIIAMIPIGLTIAKKLRVDPICGFAFIVVCILLGWTSSPTNGILTQLMMGVPPYSGFLLRAILQIPIIFIVTFFIYRYGAKVRKDPNNSVLGKGEWYDELDNVDDSELNAVESLDKRALITTIIYFMLPILGVIFMMALGYNMGVLVAISILCCYAMGFASGMSMNRTSELFAKGTAGMAFVGFVIGMANAMSLVMSQGNILHTIVYVLCIPLRGLSTGAAAIGISIVVTLVNILIPSASAKVAILCPIITPMCNALGIPLQIGVSAFKYGDAITNIISPVLGIVVGGLEVAKIQYNVYLKWAIKLVFIMFIYCWITLYFMGMFGWTGGV